MDLQSNYAVDNTKYYTKLYTKYDLIILNTHEHLSSNYLYILSLFMFGTIKIQQ